MIVRGAPGCGGGGGCGGKQVTRYWKKLASYLIQIYAEVKYRSQASEASA
jgi:hypothetical protein